MQRMLKFEIPFPSDDFVTVAMPEYSTIRAFGPDPQGVLCIWAEGDTTKPYKPERFKIIGTGHGIPEHAVYVGTTRVAPFMWHCYREHIVTG
jgi:hypothetical protein